jgi:hypothetical protein
MNMKILKHDSVWDSNQAGSVPNGGLLLELGNPIEVAMKKENHLINFRQDGSAWLYIKEGSERIENISEIFYLHRLMLEHYNVSLEQAINAQPHGDVTVSFDFMLHTMTLTVKSRYPEDVDGLPLTLWHAKTLNIDVLERSLVEDEQYSLTICTATTLPAYLALLLQPLTDRGGNCSDYFRQGISDFEQE